MSEIDRKKEEKENQIFSSVFKYCENHDVNIRTKNIVKYLNGSVVERTKNDRPDIIRICQKAGKEYIVGIEIFSVDKDSKKKSNKFYSESKKNKAKLNETYNLGHKQYIETGNVEDKICEDFLNDTAKFTIGQINSGYNNFIASFQYHFKKHADSIPEYRQNLINLSCNENIELAFIIDIEFSGYDLFCNYGKKMTKITNNSMPFFAKIVSIINEHENAKLLDYIVFYIHNPLYSTEQVIAVRAKNLKNNLKNQNIIIYDYIGENLVQIDERSIDLTKDSNFYLSYNFKKLKEDDMQKKVFPLYEKALKYQKDNKPFVASRMIQHLLYVYPYAKTIEEAYQLSDEFVKKYSVDENKDDKT